MRRQSFSSEQLVAGIAGGIGKSDLATLETLSDTGIETRWVGGYVGFASGAIRGRVGGSLAWHDVEAARAVAFLGITNSLTAAFDGESRQLFAEVGYTMPLGTLWIEPFAGLRSVWVDTDAFAGTGGVSALTAFAAKPDVQFLTLGARLGGAGGDGTGLRIEPTARIAWNHAFGDRDPQASFRFGTGSAFSIVGVAVDQDTLEADAGVTLRSGRVSIGVTYTGSFGESWTRHGGGRRPAFASDLLNWRGCRTRPAASLEIASGCRPYASLLAAPIVS